MPVLTERPGKLRSIVQVKDPFAPVRLAPVSVNGTSVPQVGVEILNDDGAWEAININSQGYQLIPNTLVQQAAREIMSRSDLQWNEEKTIWTGRFLSLMYRSDRIIEVPVLGDAVSLGLCGSGSDFSQSDSVAEQDHDPNWGLTPIARGRQRSPATKE